MNYYIEWSAFIQSNSCYIHTVFTFSLLLSILIRLCVSSHAHEWSGHAPLDSSVLATRPVQIPPVLRHRDHFDARPGHRKLQCNRSYPHSLIPRFVMSSFFCELINDSPIALSQQLSRQLIQYSRLLALQNGCQSSLPYWLLRTPFSESIHYLSTVKNSQQRIDFTQDKMLVTTQFFHFRVAFCSPLCHIFLYSHVSLQTTDR